MRVGSLFAGVGGFDLAAERAGHEIVWDILEDDPDPKYSLSARACAGILRRVEKRGRELPPHLLGSQSEMNGAVIAQNLMTRTHRNDPTAQTLIGFNWSQRVTDGHDDISPPVGLDTVAFAQNQRDELREIETAGSLSSRPGVKQQTYLSTPAVRRLTPVECERAQGFPDNWTAGQSDLQRYRQLGNAVAVPVAEWIMKRLPSDL